MENMTKYDDDVIIWGTQEKTEIGGFYMIGKRKSEASGCIAYVASLDDALKICELMTASGSVAAPKEHIYTDKEIIGLAEKEIDVLRDQFNTEQHLVKVYKKQLECVRQQLKEREESIKELLTIAERYEPIKEYQEDEEIISRAKAFLDKQ